VTDDVRIALVLSAGGLRGAAHVGVLRRLIAHQIPLHALIGVSAGAVIAGYYAGVGLDVDELIRDAARFRGRHVLVHSINTRLGGRDDSPLVRWCGVIPERLRQLERADFNRPHHGVHRLGIVCHDVRSGRPRYFSTGSDAGVSLNDAVRASASIPHLFPPVIVNSGGEVLALTDGGLTDPVPCAFARSPAIGATHVIVSDCRWIGRDRRGDATTIWIRPPLLDTGTLWSPRGGLVSAVSRGEAAVSEPVLQRIAEWLRRG
jgi:NTE family protein